MATTVWIRLWKDCDYMVKIRLRKLKHLVEIRERSKLQLTKRQTLKGNQFYTSKSVYRSRGVLLHMFGHYSKLHNEAFVAPEGAARKLINCLKRCIGWGWRLQDWSGKNPEERSELTKPLRPTSHLCSDDGEQRRFNQLRLSAALLNTCWLSSAAFCLPNKRGTREHLAVYFPLIRCFAVVEDLQKTTWKYAALNRVSRFSWLSANVVNTTPNQLTS